jgi:hypothetical protein
MKVFGIGWAKTGTTTLGACLEALGFTHVGQRLDLVPHLESGDLAAILAVAATGDAFDDWPWILLYRELDRAFPGSRFVLTRREPDRWLASYRNMLRQPGQTTDALAHVRRVLYGLPFPDVGDDALVNRYLRHNDAVVTYFRGRPERLLVVDWEQGDGWPELCRFVARPVPPLPFPHANAGDYGAAAPA